MTAAFNPDVTLFLDMAGVIQDAKFSNRIADESIKAWVGRPWTGTVAETSANTVRRLLDDAQSNGIAAFQHVIQRFPSGLEVPIEYATVRPGDNAKVIAIGKNLQEVADLQAQLITAQQTIETDYSKLRAAETRYRFLFRASSEAMLLLDAASLRVSEANLAAIRILGAKILGERLLPELASKEHDAFQAMLLRVRRDGKASDMLVHFAPDRKPYIVRASLMVSDARPSFLLQIAPVGKAPPVPCTNTDIPLTPFVDRLPDGFVIVDIDGVVCRANPAFLDLVQIGTEGSVVGEHLGRWLSRPGADLKVLLANIARHHVVRSFSTTIHGDLGSDTEVEISAVGNSETDPEHIAVLIRDVSRRLSKPQDGPHLRAAVASLSEQIGKTSLRKLVRDTVEVVERHYIEAALDLARGNRTAASELLGLSRQSLYVKLARYGLDGDATSASEPPAHQQVGESSK